MSKKQSISVVISAFNEESKIRDCLDSVSQSSTMSSDPNGLADEIIFVDNSSIDKTAQIAKEYTQKVFTRSNNPMLNVNKNFGFTKATGDWILSLDADERVTPELREEIRSVVSRQSSVVGYWIPRKNIIFGKWMEHTGWYPDYQLRLFRKGKGKFPEVHVHEMVEVQGESEKLIGHIEHLNYDNISQFLLKLINIYTPNEAEVLIKNGYQLHLIDAIRMPTSEFINRFFAQKGYKDGLHGLVLSLLMAFYHLTIFVKVWEEKGFTEVDSNNLLPEVKKEVKKAEKDLSFWFLTSSIKETKNPIEKILLKIRRRLT